MMFASTKYKNVYCSWGRSYLKPGALCVLLKTDQIFHKEPFPSHEITLRAPGGKSSDFSEEKQTLTSFFSQATDAL